MTSKLHKEFSEKCDKIKGNVLPYLEMFYGDSSRWAEASGDLVDYSIFYSRACDQVLKSTLLWGYDPGPIANEFFLPEPTAEFSQETFQNHHYNLLRRYCLDRVAMILVIEGRLETGVLREASDYHHKHLKQYGFGSALEAITELDSEIMLSTFVPYVITCKLLGSNCSDVVDHIHPSVRSREQIWEKAWYFLDALANPDSKDSDRIWSDVVLSWKSCVIASDFHSFSIAQFVLLYYLNCDSRQKDFKIRELSSSILNLH